MCEVIVVVMVGFLSISIYFVVGLLSSIPHFLFRSSKSSNDHRLVGNLNGDPNAMGLQWAESESAGSSP